MNILITDFIHIVARIQNFEQQLITFLAIFTHQRLKGFHSRCFYLLESIECIYILNGIKDVIAFRHFDRSEIASTLWNTWFLSHLLLFYIKCLVLNVLRNIYPQSKIKHKTLNTIL